MCFGNSIETYETKSAKALMAIESASTRLDVLCYMSAVLEHKDQLVVVGSHWGLCGTAEKGKGGGGGTRWF